MPRRTSILTAMLVLAVACSGGGSGGSDDAQGPPPPPFTIVRETGLAVANQFHDVALLGRIALVPVSEPELAADLNGDGDTNDMVLHRFDVDTLASTSLAVAIRGPVLTSARRFAFLVSEHDEGTDLNLDGDTLDNVWHVYDPEAVLSSTNPRNLQLATPAAGKPGAGAEGGFALVVSEIAQGADINGDQDLADDVLFAFGDFAQSVLPLGAPPYAAGTDLVSKGRYVLFTGSELSSLIDYSGDGDASDLVLGAIEFEPFGLALYRPIGGTAPRAIVRGAYALAGTTAVYLVDEAASGKADLNGDGDFQDGVIALFNLSSGTESFPNDPVLGVMPLAGSRTYGFAVSDERVLLGIDESSQGRDINIDQDKADVILGWIDIVNAPHRINVLGLTLGGVKPAVDGTLGLVTVSESAAAFEVGIDYNGDGDVGDQVAFLVNMAGSPGSTVNLGLAAGSVALRGTDAIIGVVEGGQFGTDFNGDSDVLDVVAFYVNLAGGAAAVRPLGTTYYDQVILRSPTELRIALLVPEQPFTLREDVNNDGDSDDNALLWFDIDTKETPPRVIAPTPQLIGIAAFTLDRPIVVDVDNLLFASSEKQAGIDFNGDGDTEDTMLRLAFRPPVD